MSTLKPNTTNESLHFPTSAVDQTWNRADRKRKEELGQFLTPLPVADLMAAFFRAPCKNVDLLDAGAGAGSLTSAFVHRMCSEWRRPKQISVTAYEVDPLMIGPLRRTLSECKYACDQAGIEFRSKISKTDFIATVAPSLRSDLFSLEPERFNFAIVNPPYRKIRSDSSDRMHLRSAGVETSNLYAGFVALITQLLTKGGQLVAITPRSFCNGPYFKPFRVRFLDTMSLLRLHVFESRSAAFKKEEVLQENVIIHAVKERAKPRRVIVSLSSGEPGSIVRESRVKYVDIVFPADKERFVHLPVSTEQKSAKTVVHTLSATLASLELCVSTGRVVDFRAAEYLRKTPEKDTVPLIYANHFNGNTVDWPKTNSRKPNAIVLHRDTQNLLVPAGTYVLVKRFTSKEERRRVVACIYDPRRVDSPLVGFENHLNYFHSQGQGLPVKLAKGLMAYLNSTIVDSYFRQFSGHTQVNATDLRMLRYPSLEQLERMAAAFDHGILSQDQLDRFIEKAIP